MEETSNEFSFQSKKGLIKEGWEDGGDEGFCYILNHVSQWRCDFLFTGKPGPITVKVLVKTKTSLRFQWTVLDSGQSDIEHFTIQSKEKGKDRWNLLTLKPYESEYELQNLKPFTSYIVRVLASNQYFTSDPVEIESKTQEAGNNCMHRYCNLKG